MPEGIFHRSLLLSPYIFLLAILFRYKAFLLSLFTSPENIERLNIHLGENELPLPLRDDLDGTYIFRKAFKTLTSYEISENVPITYSIMSGWIKKIGQILGIKYNIILYSLRYFTGNKLNQSRPYIPLSEIYYTD